MKFDTFISQFSDQVRRIRFTESVQNTLRERLSAYADLHAVEEVSAPERLAFLDRFKMRILQAGFAVFILAAGTGGVAYASGGALPGDTLYPVKVGFVEPLESALLTDAHSRATWNAMLAERRLSEAAALAVRGTLTEESRAHLEERFAYHTALSGGAADEVVESGDIALALAVRSDLEARLTAHSDLFAYLATEEGGEAEKLQRAVARTRDSVAAERQKTEARIAERAIAYDDRQIAAAESMTESLTRSLESAGISDSAIESRLNAAREAFVSARSSLARDEDSIAYVATQAASRLTHEASILAKNRSIIAMGLPERPATNDAAAATSPAASRPTIMLKLPVPEEDTATSTDEKSDETDEAPAKSDESSGDSNTSPDSQGSDREEESDTNTKESVEDTVLNAVKSLLGS